MTDHLLYHAKAYVALLGSVVTALLGVYAADTPVGKVLTVISVICTAVGTYLAPYRHPDEPTPPSNAGDDATYNPGGHLRP